MHRIWLAYFAAQGRTEEAEAIYRARLEAHLTDRLTRSMLASLLTRQGREEEALRFASSLWEMLQEYAASEASPLALTDQSSAQMTETTLEEPSENTDEWEASEYIEEPAYATAWEPTDSQEVASKPVLSLINRRQLVLDRN